MKNLQLISAIFLILCISALAKDWSHVRVRRIIGGKPANIPPADDPVVYTRFNGKTAKVRGVLDFPHYVFRGIPYAKPPLGKLRFMRPQEHFLEGDVDATTFSAPCVQPLPGTDQAIGSEDCLKLNIFTPDLPTGLEGLPVVIWIHGGGFRFGSASQYGVRALVGQRLVVVSIQYRLGSLGFLSGGTHEMPGNAALWDMALAVQWVRNYIGFFGGNPFKIVVMGQGSGASSALLVALSSIAKGEAAGVVAMSGTPVSSFTMDDGEYGDGNLARNVAQMNGCPKESFITMIKCLQRLPAAAIIKGDSYVQFEKLQAKGFQSGLAGGLGAAPVYEGKHDGRSLPNLVQNKPMNDMENGNIPKIPILIGTTKDETKRACQGDLKSDIVTKLTTIPEFLENNFIKSMQKFVQIPKIPLQTTIDLTSNLTGLVLNALDPFKFRKYIQVPKNDITAAVQKIAEASGDALFNAPAFLTANLWSKNGETYMFKFEHKGKLKKGTHFLNGVPLVGTFLNSTEDSDPEVVAHGDELAYLFEAQDFDGNLTDVGVMSEEDMKVRDMFTEMIAEFAKNGKPKIGKREVKPFTGYANNFIELSANPKQSSNFRFCEMGLWLGISQRLQSSTCGFLNVLDSEIKNLEKQVFNVVNQTGQQLNKITGGLLNHFNHRKQNEEEDINSSLEKLAKPLNVFKPARKKLGHGLLGL